MNEDISIKEATQKIKVFIKYLWRKSVWIVLISITGATWGYILARMDKPFYSAKTSFVLSAEKQGGGLSGLASQFGLDMSGGGGDAFAGDNIITLMQSKKMVVRALLKPIPGTSTNLANLIVSEYKFNIGWDQDARIAKSLPFPLAEDQVTPVQDSLLRSFYPFVSNKMLDIVKPDKKQSFYEVISISNNETISYYLVKYIVDVTSQFFIETKTSIARQNLQMLQGEADSIGTLLSRSVSNIAAVIDKTFNINPAYQTERSSAQNGQLRVNALGAAYAEVLRNLELAKISVNKETPLYQVIDSPSLPLEKQMFSRIKKLLIGGIISFFFSIILFSVKYQFTKPAKQ